MKRKVSKLTGCQLPTDYEDELLTLLIEECSEVIQAATKWKRFGAASGPNCGEPQNNIAALNMELGDIQTVVGLMVQARMANWNTIADRIPVKQEKFKKYLQHDPDLH